jgi:hypothetical protein
MMEQHRRDYEYRTECITNIYSRPRGQIYRLKDKREQSCYMSRISAGVTETIHDAWKKWYRDLRQRLYGLVVDMLHWADYAVHVRQILTWTTGKNWPPRLPELTALSAVSSACVADTALM